MYDLRVLRAYIEDLFNDQTLRGQAALSGVLTVPNSGNYRDYQPIAA